MMAPAAIRIPMVACKFLFYFEICSSLKSGLFDSYIFPTIASPMIVPAKLFAKQSKRRQPANVKKPAMAEKPVMRLGTRFVNMTMMAPVAMPLMVACKYF